MIGRIQLLFIFEYGVSKWERMGRLYLLLEKRFHFLPSKIQVPCKQLTFNEKQLKIMDTSNRIRNTAIYQVYAERLPRQNVIKIIDDLNACTGPAWLCLCTTCVKRNPNSLTIIKKR